MATFEKFEDLEVWKLSMDLCTDIYRLTNTVLFSKDFGLKDQIRRSAVSVPSNISEGYERDSKKPIPLFFSDSKRLMWRIKNTIKNSKNAGLFDRRRVHNN